MEIHSLGNHLGVRVTRPFLTCTSANRREACAGDTCWRPAACAHPEQRLYRQPFLPGLEPHGNAQRLKRCSPFSQLPKWGGGNKGRIELTWSASPATQAQGRLARTLRAAGRETVRRGTQRGRRGRHRGPPTAPQRSRTRRPSPPLSHGRPEGRCRAEPGGGHWPRASRRRPMGEAEAARGGGGRRAAAGVL